MKALASAALATLIYMHSIAPAVASGEIDVGAGTNEFNAGLGTSTGPTSSGSANPTSSQDIEWVPEPICVRGEGMQGDAYYGCGAQMPCGEDGLLYNMWGFGADGSVTVGGTYCDESGSPPPADVLTPGRILEAFRRIPVPSPSIGVNPVGGRTLVNFDTILHTEAEPFTETVQLLGRRVTFEIEPSEFSWRTGQGDGFTTSDPGQAYQASLPMSAYVTHRYLRAGDVQLGLDTTWTARWRVGDGPWRPVDGTVTTSSDPVPLEVVTARPQLVSYD